MPTPDELNAWMMAVRSQGDRQAFAALFKHFAPRLKGFLMRSGTPADVAEELAQDAMAALWRRAATFDPERAQLSTWLYTIARNLRVDHHRRGGAASHGTELDDSALEALEDPGRIAPEDRASDQERRRRVHLALLDLPPEQALVLQLSFFREESHGRIAEVLNIPLGTVKSRIRLAVEQLRRRLIDLES